VKGTHHSTTRPWTATLAVAAVLLAASSWLGAPAASAATDVLPDLVAPPPANPRLSTETLGDGQSHLLLRFDGFIRNVGDGGLEIHGSNPVGGVMTVSGQRIYQSDGTWRDDNSRHPVISFETADGHNHWHLQRAARFSLWNEAGTAEVAPGAKVGFCLEDVIHVDTFGPASPAYDSNSIQYCRQNQPSASSIFEGISSGWQDVYGAKLPYQWVDASDVPPGRYRLGAQVDPDNYVVESNESDNGPVLASDVVTLSGYTADPLTMSVRNAQAIPITATRYGTPGAAPLFRIESSPAHGRLNFAAGAAVTGPIVYTPNRRFAGGDSFTFSTRDPANAFPIHTPVAKATLAVAGKVGESSKHRLLTDLRFSRRGGSLIVRAHAKKSGLLRLRVLKGRRKLGSLVKRARAGHRFRCRIPLRHGSPVRARLTVTLRRHGKPPIVDRFRVPRDL
jgi:hypothetical protein